MASCGYGACLVFCFANLALFFSVLHPAFSQYFCSVMIAVTWVPCCCVPSITSLSSFGAHDVTHFLSRYFLEAENPYLSVDILRFHHKASHLFSARCFIDGRAERCPAWDRIG